MLINEIRNILEKINYLKLGFETYISRISFAYVCTYLHTSKKWQTDRQIILVKFYERNIINEFFLFSVWWKYIDSVRKFVGKIFISKEMEFQIFQNFDYFLVSLET